MTQLPEFPSRDSDAVITIVVASTSCSRDEIQVPTVSTITAELPASESTEASAGSARSGRNVVIKGKYGSAV